MGKRFKGERRRTTRTRSELRKAQSGTFYGVRGGSSQENRNKYTGSTSFSAPHVKRTNARRRREAQRSVTYGNTSGRRRGTNWVRNNDLVKQTQYGRTSGKLPIGNRTATGQAERPKASYVTAAGAIKARDLRVTGASAARNATAQARNGWDRMTSARNASRTRLGTRTTTPAQEAGGAWDNGKSRVASAPTGGGYGKSSKRRSAVVKSRLSTTGAARTPVRKVKPRSKPKKRVMTQHNTGRRGGRVGTSRPNKRQVR